MQNNVVLYKMQQLILNFKNAQTAAQSICNESCLYVEDERNSSGALNDFMLQLRRHRGICVSLKIV